MTQRVVNYTYGTGNPVLPNGSIDVRDGIDNLQSMDVLMNAPEDTYNQRDGEIVRTVSGMNNEFDAMIGGMNNEFDGQIINMGFTRVGTFAAGATLTNPRQTLLWGIADGGDGQEYGWSGAFPKVVPATSTPASTGGISVGAWISRFDPELRIQVRESLRRSCAEAGFVLVNGSFEAGGTLLNANDVLLQEQTGKVFSGPAGDVAAGTNPTGGGFADMSEVIPFTFNSVNEMKSTRMGIGTFCLTRGYYVPGDGGGASYKIVAGRPVDGYGDHAMSNGNAAELDVSKVPSIMQYGAKAGVPYNNKPAIQAAVTAANARHAATGAIQYIYSPPVKAEMGSTTQSPRVSMLSGVVLLSDGTRFKTADNAPRDYNWNAVFLFGGLWPSITCVTSGIKGLVFIDGNRQNNNPGTLDEKHSGIYISRDATDIFFDDVVIEDPAGDGLVVAQLGFPYDKDAVPKNIRFKSLICRRAWRNGVSLIDYDGVHIDYLECTDTNGTAPQAGLDIEPNYWEARARNLYIGHYVSKRNAGIGLGVLQHNNNSEQRAGTIGRFDSDGDNEVMCLFTACGLTILDGVGKNSTGTYCAEIQAAIDLKVKMDFLNNHGGFLGEITKGGVSEPDVNGATHVVVYESDNWDFSGSTFRNNGGTQLALKGVVSIDPVSGAPRTFKLSRTNLDGCKFDNGLAEGNQQSTIHLNIQSDVVNYSAKNTSIASDAPHPYYINRTSSYGRIDSGSSVSIFKSVSYPAVPANSSVVVVLAASSMLGGYEEMTIRSAHDIGALILSVYVGSGGNINMRLINPTNVGYPAGSADFIVTSSAVK